MEGLPGVVLDPGGEVWLTVDLVVPPKEPALPDDLFEFAVPRLVSGDRHIPRPEIDDEGRKRLEEWNASVWDVWKKQYEKVEQARRFYLDLFETRDQIEAGGGGFQLVGIRFGQLA